LPTSNTVKATSPLAHDTGNHWAHFEDFAALALLAHDRGLNHHAARLMGAACSLSETSGVLPRAGRETYERATAAVRTALGSDTFTAIMGDGPTPPTSTLSPRELEVLRLFATGLFDREIADTLYISHGTARTHIRNILLKLGVNSRAAAVAYGLQHGLI
jgi:DNA-binding NarL/FixJ family response regulator